MNKMLLLAGVAAVLVASNANAVELNPYVSAKLTYSDMTYDNTDRGAAGSYKDDLSDKVWGASVAAGVSTKVAGGAVRTELEYNWNDTAEDGILVGFQGDKGKVELDSQSIFLNAYYDIDTGTKFTPYIGGGIGYAKNEVSLSSSGLNISKDDTNFAWQLGAGVAYAVNDNVSVDFGYRYTDMDEIDVVIPSGSTSTVETDSHELYLGARYTF